MPSQIDKATRFLTLHLEEGTYGFWDEAGPGATAARAAFAAVTGPQR